MPVVRLCQSRRSSAKMPSPVVIRVPGPICKECLRSFWHGFVEPAEPEPPRGLLRWRGSCASHCRARRHFSTALERGFSLGGSVASVAYFEARFPGTSKRPSVSVSPASGIRYIKRRRFFIRTSLAGSLIGSLAFWRPSASTQRGPRLRVRNGVVPLWRRWRINLVVRRSSFDTEPLCSLSPFLCFEIQLVFETACDLGP